MLLGPSLFGLLLPDLQAHIFPKSQEQSNLLSVISWLGVLFLLIVTGLETDLKLILRKGKTALLISLGGIIVPFITGFGLGWLLPDSFLADPEKRLVFSLFIATAMSISAVPVIAKVLMDLKVASTIAAQTGALVMIVNVINLPQVEYILYEQRSLAPVKEIAHDLLEQQAAIGRNLGADVKTYVLQGTSPEREILNFAQTKEVDLIILGSNIRMITGRVFFGHRVDAILSKAHYPVAVITAPQSLW
ncbi:cation:proton antiporter [Desmonostoc muscorum LEGE 12446]|nr:cation:proton antiporter [Desmonostoc muscorum LEGE 12446]